MPAKKSKYFINFFTLFLPYFHVHLQYVVVLYKFPFHRRFMLSTGLSGPIAISSLVMERRSYYYSCYGTST